MTIHCWTPILKGAGYFFFTYNADNLTKPKSEQN